MMAEVNFINGEVICAANFSIMTYIFQIFLNFLWRVCHIDDLNRFLGFDPLVAIGRNTAGR